MSDRLGDLMDPAKSEEIAREQVAELHRKIADAEMAYREDVERYHDENEQRIRDRYERFYHETAPLRALADALLKNLADIEAAKVRPILVIRDSLGGPQDG